ncbi:MAG: peptide-methionine (S)-S-oxide reductase MsrA [Spirochaetales bacterium]|nr:peptide-methionine (S)-S-oxide reductase MsrA [Spirochaetales bacterium]
MKSSNSNFYTVRMQKILSLSFLGLILTSGSFVLFAGGSSESLEPSTMMTAEEPMSKPMDKPVFMEGLNEAVFAGGCFWGIEGVFERLEGVTDVVSGYSGGEAETAQYKMVGTGRTGHAEAVRIVYDPEVIRYQTLLEVFFSVAHDPTQLNYQGPDVGSEYRSVIFYGDEEQKKMSESYIEELAASGVYRDEIVTELVALEAFYPAEDYHQDFLRLNPDHPYIQYWDMPKIEQLEKVFPELIVEEM